MKSLICLISLVALAVAVPVVEIKSDEISVVTTYSPDEVRVEQNSQDVSVLLNEPIDQATKLVIDLNDAIRKYLPAEDEVATTVVPVQIYAISDVVSAVVEEVDTVSGAERQNQMAAMIDQMNRLAETIESTITDLVSRRRYVTAAMLRSMLNYVRRVRVNLERLQNRLQSVQALASTGQNAPAVAGDSNVPSNVPGSQFFVTIRDRVNRITEEIGALVSRIRGSLSPAPLSGVGGLPPLVTSAPGVSVLQDIASSQ
jgi:ribosomal protein S15P/S13E